MEERKYIVASLGVFVFALGVFAGVFTGYKIGRKVVLNEALFGLSFQSDPCQIEFLVANQVKATVVGGKLYNNDGTLIDEYCPE